MISAATGAVLAVQHTWQSYLLIATFLVASIIQYFYNSTYSDATTALV